MKATRNENVPKREWEQSWQTRTKQIVLCRTLQWLLSQFSLTITMNEQRYSSRHALQIPNFFFLSSLPVFRIWKLTRAAVNVTVHLASGLCQAAGNQDANLTLVVLPLDCPRIAGPEYISTDWIAEMAVIHKGESRDFPTLLASPHRNLPTFSGSRTTNWWQA